ncbi:hypothetical protein [Bifidobacterium santillanense]|uniref:hypothetical protein n=1 Tax=Bifidobacterium santillanense TaxID=2809028 RepID=UPI001F0A9B41|nr:hypothetical protein [Bifidobacterium santillanense]
MRRCALDDRTVILTAHDIDELQRIATHVLIIMSGVRTTYGALGQIIADSGGEAGTMFRFASDADGTRKTAAMRNWTEESVMNEPGLYVRRILLFLRHVICRSTSLAAWLGLLCRSPCSPH